MFRLFFLLVCLCLNSFCLIAKEIEEDLEEVVVTATRSNLSKKKVTQSIQVVENKEISQQQVTDAHEILRDVPGVSVTQTGSRGGPTSLFIRGGGANHNLVLIDGVRVNQAGGSFEFAYLPLDNIEKIEVLKGPQSALYGSDGMGGVIQIMTKKGRGKTTTDFSIAGGNYNTFEERVQTSGGLGNGGFSLGASRIDSDGILNVNNRFGETSFSARFDQKLYESVDLDGAVRYIDVIFQFPTENSGDRLQGLLDPDQYWKRKRAILSSNLSAPLTAWWKQKLQLGYQSENRFSKDERNPGIDTAWSQSSNVETRQSVDYSWDFSLPKLADITGAFTAGVAYEKENFEQTSRRVTTSTTSTAIDQLRSNYAYYFQTQWDWNELVFFTPSVRVEQNETFSTETSPKFTGGFRLPWTDTKIRGTWGKGITAPSFTQVFGSGGTTVGNLNLKPEQVESWEAGIDQSFLEGALEANITYFYNLYDDLISFITPTFFNIQSAKSEGVESSVQIKKAWNDLECRLVLSHTLVETKALVSGGVGGTGFTQGEQLLRRPKHRGAVTVNLNHPRFNINWNSTFQGESLDRDFSKTPEVRVALPGYVKTDLSISVVAIPGSPEWRVFTKIENLFDEKYEEVYGFSTARIKVLSGIGVKF